MLGGISWLTLLVLVFLTLGAMSPPTPDQAALRQFSFALLLLSGLAVVVATFVSNREYQKLLEKL